MTHLSRSKMNLPGRIIWILLVLLFVCSCLFVVSLSIGEPYIPIHDLYMHVAYDTTIDKIHRLIIYEIRMPRTIVAIMAGIMLALTGSLLQDAFQNDLAGPELIGVSSGASFMIAILTVFHLSVPFSMYPLLG